MIIFCKQLAFFYLVKSQSHTVLCCATSLCLLSQVLAVAKASSIGLKSGEEGLEKLKGTCYLFIVKYFISMWKFIQTTVSGH